MGIKRRKGSEPKHEKDQKDGDEKMKENLNLDYEKKASSKNGCGQRQSFRASFVADPSRAAKQKPGEPPCEQFAQ